MVLRVKGHSHRTPVRPRSMTPNLSLLVWVSQYHPSRGVPFPGEYPPPGHMVCLGFTISFAPDFNHLPFAQEILEEADNL